MEPAPGRLLRVEDRFTLAGEVGGCRRDDGDYLHAAMVLTHEPPAVDGVEARRIETFEEFVASRLLHRQVFRSGASSSPTSAATSWAARRLRGPAGRGAYRAVVRARWDEAVRRGTPALAVGFEQVLRFRRLESVRSGT